MSTTLFALLIALSVAIAACALIVAAGRRPIPALTLFAAAFTGEANACLVPGHRSVPAAVTLLVCAAALLATAGRLHVRGKQTAQHG